MPELLLELLSEEIPARMQTRAAEDLQRLVCDGLNKAGLDFDSAAAFATPRRLTLVVAGLPEKQPDIKDERKGPQVGAPEQAINGFLGSLAGLTLDDCEQREVKGKTFWFAMIDKKGKPTADVLKDILETALLTMAASWPKSMRWGESSIRWARPLHSILCLYDGAVIPVELDPITASNATSGHRFHNPNPFKVKNVADYKTKLLKNKVMLDAAERRTFIEKEVKKLVKDAGLTMHLDNALLDEVAGLVEWPVVLMGSIDSEFMDVPPEVLIAAMRGHQKYFSCLDKDGKLASKFIFVSNMETKDKGKAIIAGNERVLRARLSDTKFFWDQDRKQGLESRLPKLAGVIFHAKLGSVLEKVERMTALAGALCSHIPGADVETVERAAKLCKADLVTGMVGELPELQGLMGQYYALETGEDESVALAIAEHYSPAGPGDACPEAPTSVAVALADKVDTLVGFWAINEKPTGSKDPFALRRAALGVIRLIIENNLRFSLSKVFAETVAEYMTQNNADVQSGMAADDDSVATAGLDAWHMPDLLAFFADRLKVHLKEKGVRHDLIDAVFALGEDDLVRVLARVEALGAFLGTDDGANLLVAYKRAANILKIEEKKDAQSYDQQPYSEGKPEQDEEVTLLAALQDLQGQVDKHLGAENFTAAMSEMAKLRGPLDAFFDKVTVNSDDAETRAERLRLLSKIRTVMGAVADFSKIEG
ncbi:MAG: glycine--tRNA ligase subunit beta [Rhodospirillaceae bacterium]|nr:glycine--tRNA ligase subunit beta [Rhodospirillaceae bacterium]MBL6931207.1 glycine--tRNA ligase subunit beta [Rhodospirillales bacterium]MBL6941739.1 glycine--tRNA ligase subunit beta [Rhodospirillales bacterium]